MSSTAFCHSTRMQYYRLFLYLLEGRDTFNLHPVSLVLEISAYSLFPNVQLSKDMSLTLLRELGPFYKLFVGLKGPSSWKTGISFSMWVLSLKTNSIQETGQGIIILYWASPHSLWYIVYIDWVISLANAHVSFPYDLLNMAIVLYSSNALSFHIDDVVIISAPVLECHLVSIILGFYHLHCY